MDCYRRSASKRSSSKSIDSPSPSRSLKYKTGSTHSYRSLLRRAIYPFFSQLVRLFFNVATLASGNMFSISWSENIQTLCRRSIEINSIFYRLAHSVIRHLQLNIRNHRTRIVVWVCFVDFCNLYRVQLLLHVATGSEDYFSFLLANYPLAGFLSS